MYTIRRPAGIWKGASVDAEVSVGNEGAEVVAVSKAGTDVSSVVGRAEPQATNNGNAKNQNKSKLFLHKANSIFSIALSLSQYLARGRYVDVVVLGGLVTMVIVVTVVVVVANAGWMDKPHGCGRELKLLTNEISGRIKMVLG